MLDHTITSNSTNMENNFTTIKTPYRDNPQWITNDHIFMA